MSWLADELQTVEDDVKDAASAVEAKAENAARWVVGQVDPAAGYLVGGPKDDAPQDGATVTAQQPGSLSQSAANAWDTVKGYASQAEDYAITLLKPPGGPSDEEFVTAAHDEPAKLEAIADKVGEKGKQALTLLDWLTKPWVLGGIAVVVGLAVAGPYVLPFIRGASK